MSKSLNTIALVLLVALLAGCDRSSTTTVIHKDGSFDRTVELSSSSKAVTIGKQKPQRATPAESLASIRSHYVLTSHGRLVYDRHHPDQDPAWIAKRHYARGKDVYHDVVIKSDKGVKVIANEASVRPLGDGRWVFTERYHWIGKPFTDKDLIDRDSRACVKSVLGPQTDTATIDRLTARVIKDWVLLVAGPTPAVPAITLSAENANERLLPALEKTLKRQAASPAESEASHKLASDFIALTTKVKTGAGQILGGVDCPLNTVDVSVKFPGNVLETDGKLFPDGTVHWTFLSVAIIAGDIKLSVIYKPNP